MSQFIQKTFAWAGPVFIVVLLPSFWVMGFLPPISPTLSPTEMAAHLDERRGAYRLGATLIMQSGLFMFLWAAAISAQIRRIENGGPPVLTYAQMILSVPANFFPVLAALLWSVVAFRPERSPELLILFNDLAWLMILMPAAALMLQAIVIGVAILSDDRATPLFPRWAAYLNFWVALLLLPGVVTSFFKTGPFAWDGLLVFWVPILAFFAWIIVMAWLVARAVDMPDEETP